MVDFSDIPGFDSNTINPAFNRQTNEYAGRVRRRRTTDGSRGREPAVERSPIDPSPPDNRYSMSRSTNAPAGGTTMVRNAIGWFGVG